MDFPIREVLSQELSGAGFFGFAFLSSAKVCGILKENEADATPWASYLGEGCGGIAAVALQYGEGIYSPPSWAQPYLGYQGAKEVHLARFCRADWYAELKDRLGVAVKATVARAATAGIQLPAPRKWKRLANSRLPERPLAIAAGLGFQGKNNLLIAAAKNGSAKPGFSSAVVLGLLVCPEEIELEPETAQECNPNFPGCGTCGRCISACPTGALSPLGNKFLRERCIQHWTSQDESPPGDIGKARESRLYGCDICLEACPYFFTDALAQAKPGRLGQRLPAAYFRASEPDRIQADLKKTALGPRWISKKSLKRFAEGLGT